LVISAFAIVVLIFIGGSPRYYAGW
jgi:hypothetical protein